jgi:cytochrome P450
MGGRQDSSTYRSTADRGDYFPNAWHLQRNADNEDRICLGQQFALTEAGYVIVRLLQRFDKLDNSAMHGLQDDWYLTLTGRPLHGVKLRLHAAVEN